MYVKKNTKKIYLVKLDLIFGITCLSLRMLVHLNLNEITYAERNHL